MFLILGNFYLKLDVKIFDILRNILYLHVCIGLYDYN